MPAIGKRGAAEGFMRFSGKGGPCRRAPHYGGVLAGTRTVGAVPPARNQDGGLVDGVGFLGGLSDGASFVFAPPSPLARELAGVNCVITTRTGDGAPPVPATPEAFREVVREVVCPPDSLPGLRRPISAAPPTRPKRPTSMAIPTAFDTKAPASLAVATAPDKLPVSPLNETPSMLPVIQVENPRTPAASPVIIPRNAS